MSSQNYQQNYQVVSIEPSDPPGEMEGSDWHCYTIEQGENQIRGYQQGTMKAVRRAVDEIVVRLNERRYGKSGRVQLTMSSSPKKAAAKKG